MLPRAHPALGVGGRVPCVNQLIDSFQQPSEVGATVPTVQLGKLRHRAFGSLGSKAGPRECSWLFLCGILFLLGSQSGASWVPYLLLVPGRGGPERGESPASLPRPQPSALLMSLTPHCQGSPSHLYGSCRKPATAPNASPGGSHARAGVSFPSIFLQPLPVRKRGRPGWGWGLGGGRGEDGWGGG